jgi:putative ABC transport system permease protein
LRANDLATAVRHEIAAVDPGIIVWLGPYNLDDRLAVTGGVFGNIRNHAVLFVAFAAIAMLLAAIGLYAVVAYSVKERIQEIGVRMALGATARHIFAILMKLGILPVTVGLIIGLAGSLALSRLLAFELIGVPPHDLVTLLSACAVLFLSAVVACLIPARGALRTDPATVLRGQ